MYKIYSRPRIRLPKIFIRTRGIKGTKAKKMATLIVILIIALLTAKFVLDAISPIFENLCENKAQSIATNISNEQVATVMKKHNYEEFYTIQKDNDGNIRMINANIIYINEIVSDIANRIQQQIDAEGSQNVEISLGSFTGLKLFAGRGPSVKIKIIPIGSVETDLKSEFISQGVNQTLHRIYLQVDCSVEILTPFQNIQKKISNQVLLMENVIVGNIPETYYNLEGMEGGSDTLNVIQ